MDKNKTYMLIAVLAAICCLCLYSVWRLTEHQTAAAVAAGALRESEVQVERIRAARAQAPADPSRVAAPEVVTRIRDAATEAGIVEGVNQGVVSFDPGLPQRVLGTDYLEVDVPVRLEQVTMQQVVGFLHRLSTGDASLRAKLIDLRAPDENDLSPNWSADVTLTYRIRGPRGEG